MRSSLLWVLFTPCVGYAQSLPFRSGVSADDTCHVTRAYVLCTTDTTRVFTRIFRGCSDGTAIDYYPNGKAESAFTSVPGGQDKISLEWFEDGMLKSERVDRGEGNKGYYKEWHPSGALKFQAELREGHLDGHALEWDQQCTLIRDEYYRAGKLKRARVKGPKE
jgi:hypothetical protein